MDGSRNNGQLVRVEGFINNAKKWQTRYDYDALGRLQRAAEHRGDNSSLVWRDHYEYDRYGNRWQSSYENTGRAYVDTYQSDYDPATNRFVAPWWQYDAAGNLTEDQIFGYQSHIYDAKSRNVSVTSLATQQVISSAVYDGLGQRVQTTEGSVTRRQVYDASGMVIAEYENGLLKRECIYGNGELLSTVEPGNGARHQLNDQQGSSRVAMDDNGLIKARHDYFPFGEEIGYVGMRLGSQGYGQVDGNRKRYAGMEKDGPTGQDQTWFRKADTRSGRWTSPDPYGGSLSINNPQSTNRYSYVENDPLNYTDPMGLFRNRPRIGPPLTIPGFRDASWGDYGDSWFGGSGSWDFGGNFSGGGSNNPPNPNPCDVMSAIAQSFANKAIAANSGANSAAVMAFNAELTALYVGASIGSSPLSALNYYRNWPQPTQSRAGFKFERNSNGVHNDGIVRGDDGFRSQYKEESGDDQTHHAVAYLDAGINGQRAFAFTHAAIDNRGDRLLGLAAFGIGAILRDNPSELSNIRRWIATGLCDPASSSFKFDFEN